MCGVLGLFNVDDIATKLLIGLGYLQRRGYDSAGIGIKYNGKYFVRKALGKVENLKNFDYPRVKGTGIGQVRYATSGDNLERDAQPLIYKNITIAHNGEILNLNEIKEKYHVNFETGCDLEGILGIFKSLPANPTIEDIIEGVREVMTNVRGAYSVVAIINDKLVVFRDPYGIRPLVRTKYGFASESLPLNEIFPGEEIYQVEPGSVVILNKEGEVIERIIQREQHNCGFEYAYFAHQNSEINGISVMKARERIGDELSKYAKGDAIVPIPNTPIPIATRISHNTGIELKTLVVKESKERIFQKSEKDRRNSYMYYTINPSFKGEINSITLVDDSIVRGTNIKGIIRKIREVYGDIYINVLIGFPKIISPCPFGIDMKTRGELIALKKVGDNYRIRSDEEIAKEIGANELHHISVEEFIRAIGNGNLCMGCTTRYYPGIDERDIKEMEERRLKERKRL